MTFLARTLQLALAVVLVAAVALWFASRRGDRGFIEAEVTIARPSATVFRWISSEDLVRRWISDLVELKRVDVTSRVPDFRMVEVISGHPTAMEVKIVRVVPNQEIRLQISSADLTQGPFAGEAEFRLLGTGDYTRLVFTSHTRFFRLRDRICEPIWTYATKYKMRDDLAKLKLLLESEAGGAPNLHASALSRRSFATTR